MPTLCVPASAYAIDHCTAVLSIHAHNSFDVYCGGLQLPHQQCDLFKLLLHLLQFGHRQTESRDLPAL